MVRRVFQHHFGIIQLTAVPMSGHFAGHILAAEGILHAQRTLGIITPFAIHKKAVMMNSRGQRDLGMPYSTSVFL